MAVLGLVTVVVTDYDAAIAWYTEKLGFVLLEDREVSVGKRWVRVGPSGGGTALLLARAANPSQQARIGDQTGGRVAFFLHTTDFWADYHAMQAKGVTFCEAPRQERYGMVVVFEDGMGNRWDLLEVAGS